MKISAFSFIHNALASGYPIKEAIESVRPFVDEIVIVDMQSTDGTRELLNSLPVRIVNGIWDCKAGETLARAHAQHTECEGDIIVHFEGDEVFDESLIVWVIEQIKNGHQNISVERIQVEQNFQRVRWYPHFVHRVFPKGSVVKIGETTDKKDCDDMYFIKNRGYLWDCTNCFRSNWLNRVSKQSELRDESLNLLYAPKHIDLPNRIPSIESIHDFLTDELWTANSTPLNIPEILLSLVGEVKYDPYC